MATELAEGPAVAERIEREPIDLDVLGSTDRTAALHFDLVLGTGGVQPRRRGDPAPRRRPTGWHRSGSGTTR